MYLILSTIFVLQLQMTTLYESFLKGPKTIMTLTSAHDYPKILKDMMKHIHLEGDAVYKGYPFMQKGVELWYVEVHLHRMKGVCPKMMGSTFSSHVYHKQLSSTLFVKQPWKPYARSEIYLKQDSIILMNT